MKSFQNFLQSQKIIKQSWRDDTFHRPISKAHLIKSIIQDDYCEFKPKSNKRRDIRDTYKILSLDGGGVRGVLTIGLLERIIAHHPKFLDDLDFTCGTSA